MHTKWAATFLGLKLFAAILVRMTLCQPQRTNFEDGTFAIGQNRLPTNKDTVIFTAIIYNIPGNCTTDVDCSLPNTVCYKNSCRCRSNYIQLESRCRVKVALHDPCEYDAQCSLKECIVADECRCNNDEGENRGNCVYSYPDFSNPTGMMKVLMVITGFVIVATVTCIVTILYKRLGPRNIRRAPVPEQNQYMEQGINPVPSVDSPPPKYEEVIRSGPTTPTRDYVDPPSYGEYLEHQRNSLQPMIEPVHRPPRRTNILTNNTTRMNDSLFLGRF